MAITGILSSPLVYDTWQYIARGTRYAPLFVNDMSVCRQHATVFPFSVPLEAMDAALRDAAQHIGATSS